MSRILISATAAIAITAVACEKQSFEPKLERGEIEITRADLADTYWYRTITTEDYDAEGNLILTAGVCNSSDRIQIIHSCFHLTENELWDMCHYSSTATGE